MDRTMTSKLYPASAATATKAYTCFCSIIWYITMSDNAGGQSTKRCNKSSVSLNRNTPTQLQQELGAIFRVLMAQGSGKYLGLPMKWGRSKKQTLTWVKVRRGSKQRWQAGLRRGSIDSLSNEPVILLVEVGTIQEDICKYMQQLPSIQLRAVKRDLN
ncbi:unnamed protein product [Ilex paraguariensis]|uniref:Uncharacterized protein n=1 Tax=Ilex paraguariensis TaxID=185542 RepID=A0ABC8SAL1_9AQUA